MQMIGLSVLVNFKTSLGIHMTSKHKTSMIQSTERVTCKACLSEST